MERRQGGWGEGGGETETCFALTPVRAPKWPPKAHMYRQAAGEGKGRGSLALVLQMTQVADSTKHSGAIASV